MRTLADRLKVLGGERVSMSSPGTDSAFETYTGEAAPVTSIEAEEVAVTPDFATEIPVTELETDNPSADMAVALRLEQARRGIKMKEFAELLHISPNRLSKVLRGESSLSDDTKKNIAALLGTTSWLMAIEGLYERLRVSEVEGAAEAAQHLERQLSPLRELANALIEQHKKRAEKLVQLFRNDLTRHKS